MVIRLGFVAMSLLLENASPSKTITYSSYKKLTSDESRLYRLRKLTEENLVNTLRVMIHANASDIKLYRITSRLVPLATHPEVIKWDYTNVLAAQFQKISEFIKTKGMRISAHPDHFTLLTSPRADITEASVRDLEYHDRILTAMGLGEEGKLVLHIGGVYKDKKKAIDMFISNCSTLPLSIRKRIILENDDKSYNASETLELCRLLNIPMVLDVHHHICNPDGLSVNELLGPVFETWNTRGMPPKVHFSSPKSVSEIRSHADNIDSAAFYRFIKEAAKLNISFDIMLEAKNKDKALFQLMDDLKAYKDITLINQASIELK